MRPGRPARRATSFPAVALVLVSLAGLLTGCGGAATPGPQATVRRFLAGWARRDWAGMRLLVAKPPADFAAVNSSALAQLGVTRAGYLAGEPVEHGDEAEVPVVEHLELAGIGPLVLDTRLALVSHAGRWLVEWSPATIDPLLTSRRHFVVSVTWAPRAPILGSGGAALTTLAPMVVIGVEGNYVKDAASLLAALVSAGAPASSARQAIAAAKVHPSWFEPVFTVPRARYLVLKPVLYPLPGTVFQAATMREAITPGLEAHLVGGVGPITAQELGELGPPYGATSVVGQSGLEQVYQSQLAGSPGATIGLASRNGTVLAVLATIAPRPGKALVTSIDPAVQRAAETALAGQSKNAALVAVRASTGQVIASVSDPGSDDFDQALDGAFPPGSTFKTITSTALIEGGLSPASPASCPTTITVDGEVFHNAEGDSPVSDLAQAFTESCNTAFIGLATTRLDSSSLPAAARLYDIGRTPAMGIAAFGGSVPAPDGAAALAATAIGQGEVLVSPLDMAMVAAAIDSGVVREPRLVAGAPDDRAATHKLGAAVVAELREMMAEVVARGTAANEGLPPGTYAKTGTAEYGVGNPPPTDAWLIGFNGDIAFAVLVVGGGFGGPTCGPIAARFLDLVAKAS